MNNMMALGMFVFTLRTLPFSKLDRSTTWRHPTNSVINKLPSNQFLGKGSDTLSLSGTLALGVTGSTISLKMIHDMADSGQSFPLLSGTFELLGFYRIESIKQTKRELFDDGTARLIDFSIELAMSEEANLLTKASDLVNYL